MAEKIGLFARTRIFIGEVRTEMSKVVWPSREQTKTYTIVVLAASAAVCVAIGLWDLVLSRAMGVIFGVDI